MPITSRFLDPLTDFGFKRLFGSEPDKDIMIDFLNVLFEGEKVIADISYSPTEINGASSKEKKVLFDLTCTGADGEKFIIEMQRTDQEFFSDRCVFYMSRLISSQLAKDSSNWSSALSEVYLIGIMEFSFKESDGDYLHNIKLANLKTGKVFHNGMGYKFLELPNFDKSEAELQTDLDKWFYVLKNLSSLDKIPAILDKRVFQKIFKIAEVSKMTKEEQELYDSDLKAKSDWNAGIEWAKKQAAQEAFDEASKEAEQRILQIAHDLKMQIARKLKQKGASDAEISELTELSLEEIKAL
ncbi:Rpn family recombination-promoting nuclease/putative transposase [Pedobacter deserti]|uniref:Rpn family recombination-promoting nuclease/putative transposase n=1 Tax=Pedobacter deserti TaxID=2817382 RepID=UPI0021095F40|nr:Rpn family recombination-promoting nuclease/putative transposase [Pedobacter sp. SYSU D00382]